MVLDIVTALPGLVEGPLQHSIIRRAQAGGHVKIGVHDIRAFASGKHRQIDDYPYGGSAGMVLKPEPIFSCIEAIQKEADSDGIPVDEVIFLTPDGVRLDQHLVTELSLNRRMVLLAGHYKGIDQRVRDALVTKEVSIGDYVLSGGELPALILVDALIRLVPGVLGDVTSALSDSFQEGLLGAPTYTRPAVFRGMKVPDVLMSGNHKKIQKWHEEQQYAKTAQRRPDLLGTPDMMGISDNNDSN